MKVKCVRVTKGITDAAEVKESYSDSYRMVFITADSRKHCKTRNRAVATAVSAAVDESLLKRAYMHSLPVSVAKKADLLKLCASGVIKSHFHAWMDSLLASKWTHLEDISSLLEPFAVLTDLLQTDAQSLSSILPSLLDLECHLQQFPSAKSLASNMLKYLRSRMKDILDPESETFKPLPASASLLDPTIAKLLLVPDMAEMLHSSTLNEKHPLWGQIYRAEIHRL